MRVPSQRSDLHPHKRTTKRTEPKGERKGSTNIASEGPDNLETIAEIAADLWPRLRGLVHQRQADLEGDLLELHGQINGVERDVLRNAQRHRGEIQQSANAGV